MKYRLDGPHYIDDMELPAGTEIGDETGVPFRHVKDTPDGKGGVLKAGSPKPPSRQMIPLDDEARKLFKAEFGTDAPERDPTASIPVQGTGSQAKAPAPGAPRPGAGPIPAQYKAPLLDASAKNPDNQSKSSDTKKD